MKRHRFIIQQISNYGSAEPIVARLGPQTAGIIQFFPLTEEKRQAIMSVMHEEIIPVMMECSRISERISNEVADGISTFAIRDNKTTLVIPSVMSLDVDVSTFFVKAKNALGNYLKVMNVLLDETLESDGNYRKLLGVIRDRFGPDSPIFKNLDRDSSWRMQIVNFRNAKEHQNGHSGVVEIRDFQFRGELIEPVILYNKNGSGLFDDPIRVCEYLNVTVNNLLTFFEEFFVDIYHALHPANPINFVEIREEARDPQCPIRLRACINSSAR